MTCRPRPSKSLAVCLFVRFGGSRTVAHCSTKIKIILLMKLFLLGPRSFCRSSCCYYDQDHFVHQVVVTNFESDTNTGTYCDTNNNKTLTDLVSCQLKSNLRWAHSIFWTQIWRNMSKQFKGKQGCISCGILLFGIRARGVSSEHMENMEMFSCSPT